MILLEIKKNIKSLILWILCIGSILVASILIFPILQEETFCSLIIQKISYINPIIRQIFHFDIFKPDMHINAYYSFIFQLIGVASCIYACKLGVESLSKEENRGNIFYLYSLPISRIELVIKKMIANLLTYFLYILAIAGLSYASCYYVQKQNNVQEIAVLVILITGGFYMIGIAYMIFGMLFSAKKTKHINITSILIILTSIGFGIIGKCFDSLRFLILLSPYHYVDPPEVLVRGIPYQYLIIVGLFFIIALCFCTIIYRYRNFIINQKAYS